eukprot:CAMPEP_0172784034 /NCGR_PEP_ID=MMETSP1074-20121228/204736_1 /TAXON_ID=2916 /ORGANISM="Ceratium fusus, Strain PA161109" /LENGTH=458 /DNA_ID=CAMNT_0013621033 /DNA_START=139 /DNA_END=1515 /DNA_ORIENTATION=+
MTPKRLQQMLHPILEASYEAVGRQEIMKHLCGCLSEPSGKKWHRIFAGMVLTEKLINQGSDDLMVETFQGHHFDLVQKVSLLERSDSAARGCTDKGAQLMLQKKAMDLRTTLRLRLKKASCEELPQNAGLGFKDTLSTCSLSCMSTSTASTAAGSGMEGSTSFARSDVAPERPSAGVLPFALFHGMDAEGIINNMDSQRAVACTKLQDTLHGVMESGFMDIPVESSTTIMDASHYIGSRQVILMFLQNCLSEQQQEQQQQQQQQQASEHWRRVYCGLVLAHQLLENGSPLFFSEAACALNDFDLAREVYLLQFFEYRTDWRAQRLVRKKATELHERLIERVQFSTGPPDAHIDDAFVDLRVWVDAAQNCPVSFSARPPSEETCDETFQELILEQREQATAAMPLRSTKEFGASLARKTEGEVPVVPEEPDEAFATPWQTPATAGCCQFESPLQHHLSL